MQYSIINYKYHAAHYIPWLTCFTTGSLYLFRKIPWRRKWQPTPVLLPGKFHGLRSLLGYSPWGRKESDTTERLQRSSSLTSHPLRRATTNLFSVSVCVYVCFFRLYISVRSFGICLSLTYFTYNALKMHPCCHKWQNFIVFHDNNIPFMYFFFIHSPINGHLDCFHYPGYCE